MKYTKTPITWYGGKQSMLKYIIPVIPEHTLYTESYFGGGAVYFAKAPVKCEVINDLNREAQNFYTVAKTNVDRLNYYVSTTLHSRSAYDDAKVIYKHPHLFDEVERAGAFYTMANQSFSAGMSTWGFDRVGTTSLKVCNKREAFGDYIRFRLANTTIECDDALKVIQRYDREGAFHYVDPPYFNSNCGHYTGYSEHDFELLLKGLSSVKGKFLLSSYPSPVLTSFAKRNQWEQWEVTKKIAVSKNAKGIKTEVLTANYPIKTILNRLAK